MNYDDYFKRVRVGTLSMDDTVLSINEYETPFLLRDEISNYLDKNYGGVISNDVSIIGNFCAGDDSSAENYSIALGLSSKSSGNGSIAAGIGLNVENDAEFAVGQYNARNDETLYSVGFGSASTERKNAIEIDKSGNVYVNGVGGYDGTNSDEEETLPVKDVISSIISNEDKFLDLSAGGEISGDLGVLGKLTVSNDVAVGGNIDISGDVSIDDNASVNGDLTVSGDINASDLKVSGSFQGGENSSAQGSNAFAYGDSVSATASNSFVAGLSAKAENDNSFVWNGNSDEPYSSTDDGTFNVNPVSGADGFYIGEQKLTEVIDSRKPELSAATSTALGSIKIGFVSDSTSKNYAVQLSDDHAYVNVPWQTTSIISNAYYVPDARQIVIEFDNAEIAPVSIDIGDVFTAYEADGKTTTLSGTTFSVKEGVFKFDDSQTIFTFVDGNIGFNAINGAFDKQDLIDSGVISESGAEHWIKPLKELKVGNLVTSLDADAFLSCDELTTIIIPNSVSSINQNAFQPCALLSSIIFTDRLESDIPENSPWGAPSTTSVIVDNGIGQGNVSTIDIEWSDLVALRNYSKLIPGQTYRITDYVTVVDQENCRSAGHQFDIIVTAITTSTLSEDAKAAIHDGDTYFLSSEWDVVEDRSNYMYGRVPVESWQIKYCIDNDKKRFAWADETNGKGVIYWMRDEFDNEAYYDFKNVQFKCNKISSIDISNDYIVSSFTEHSLVGTYGISSDTVKVDGSDSLWCYTFNGMDYASKGLGEPYDFSCRYIKPINPQLSIIDPNLDNVLVERLNLCYGNKIGKIVLKTTSTDLMFGSYVLPGNVFQCELTNEALDSFPSIQLFQELGYAPGYCMENIINDRCCSNVFGKCCTNNVLGTDCTNNIFGNFNDGIVFSNYCKFNAFGEKCDLIKFGDICEHNIFFDSCSRNSFGNSCLHNLFENGCIENKFDDYCQYNKLKSDCQFNVFGSSCTAMDIYSNCSFNEFGLVCDRNTLSGQCISNKFNNYCSNNILLDCNNNIFGIDTSRNKLKSASFNLFGNDCSENELNNVFQNIFGNHCWNNICSSENSFITYNKFGGNCKFNKLIGRRISLNVFGENCLSNILSDECLFNSFGDYDERISCNSYCQINSFGKSNYETELGLSSMKNYFGDQCHNIYLFTIFDDRSMHCSYMVFDTDCYSISAIGSTGITFGRSCNNIRFAKSEYVSFGNYCHHTMIQADLHNSSFGDYCSEITASHGSYVTFGNSCFGIILPDNSTHVSFGDYSNTINYLIPTRLENVTILGKNEFFTFNGSSNEDYIIRNVTLLPNTFVNTNNTYISYNFVSDNTYMRGIISSIF